MSKLSEVLPSASVKLSPPFARSRDILAPHSCISYFISAPFDEQNSYTEYLSEYSPTNILTYSELCAAENLSSKSLRFCSILTFLTHLPANFITVSLLA